jgi:glycosyltransferase involved in cell wall biosynthesis
MKTFATLFPFLRPEHIDKDVGKIPSLLAKRGYDSMLVGIERDGVSYPKMTMKLGLLKPGGLRGHLEMNVLSFLQSQSAKIDVLNLYHLRRDTIFYGQWYKKHNPQGLLYLKMDSYNEELQRGVRYSSNFFKNLYFKFHANKFLKAADLVSVENKEGLSLLKRSYPKHAQKMIYLPNGVEKRLIQKGSKKPVILSVGRMDDPVKNYDLLLDVIPQLDNDDYSFVLIGRGHEERAEQFFSAYPEMRNRVTFMGPIRDRKKLFAQYAKASIYVQPSLHESFGLAMAEALCHGCYLVGTTGMSAFSDLSNDGEYGICIDPHEPESLKKALQSLITKRKGGIPDPQSVATFGKEQFVWETIADKLAEEIELRL